MTGSRSAHGEPAGRLVPSERDPATGSPVSGSVESRPVRTCIGCRHRDSRDRMMRIVADAGDGTPVRVVVDVAAVLPGRGAWLHIGCIERAVRGRAVSRALRIAGDADVAQLRSYPDPAPARTTVLDRREGSGIEADGHPMSTQR